MTELTHEMLSDRMPEVARGTAEWSPAEAAHLAACAECRAEWRVVEQGVRLGAEVAGKIDVAAIATGVEGRLAAARRRRSPAPLWLGIAAAAAITIVVLRPAAPAVATAEAVRFLPELDSLTTEELTLVAEGLDVPLAETELIEGEPLEALDSTQLERVLRSLEG